MIPLRTHNTVQNSDSVFHADATSRNGSLSPESNLRLVYSLCYFVLHCPVFILLDLCKPLSFYIHLTLFIRCFIYDDCFCLLDIHCHTIILLFAGVLVKALYIVDYTQYSHFVLPIITRGYRLCICNLLYVLVFHPSLVHSSTSPVKQYWLPSC